MRHLIFSMPACCLCIMTQPVGAAFFSAEATALNQSTAIISDSHSGSNPVDANALHDAIQPVATGSAMASARSQRGRVSVDTLTSSSVGKFSAAGTGIAVYDDVVFSFTGGGAAPSTVNAGLNFNLDYSQSASGALGSTNGWNTRQISYNVQFHGESTGGNATFDVSGPSISPGFGGSGPLYTEVPVGTPVTVRLYVFAGSSATRRGATTGTANTDVSARLSVTSMMSSAPASPAPLSFSTLGMMPAPMSHPLALVFDLPPGFTVNSESMGVVDNVWIYAPIPEPSSVAMMLAGLGVLAAFAAYRGRHPAT